MKPTVSPHDALAMIRANRYQDIAHADGFTYMLDGPQGCPIEEMVAFAVRGDRFFYPPGEHGDPILPEAKWMEEL